MFFKKGSAVYATEIERREGEDVLYINMLGLPLVPSIAENPEIMARVIDLLAENPNVSRIVFVQQRNYSYPSKQILLLSEIASILNFLTKQEEILSPRKLSLYGSTAEVHEDIQYLLTLLKRDPIACYLELKTRIEDLGQQFGQAASNSNLTNYIRFLKRFRDLLDSTKLIKDSMNLITTSAFGKRAIYRTIFRPEVLPNFTFTRLAAQLPKDAELIDQYELLADEEQIVVTILKRKNDSKYFYHVMPPEYALSENHHMLLNLGRNVLSEHRPKSEEFTDPERTRKVFFNIARDMLSELSKSKGINLSYRELVGLAKILVRHTIGFGVIELLLTDSRLQDIVLNAPITQNPIFVRHEKYDECVTNVIPSFEDANSWAAKLRLVSGRPLDEANPILDTDLTFENARARVAATTQPLSPKGLAYAFRRHRDQPWTLPLFIKNKMLNSFTAGLLSFLIDGSRTLLVAGTRSSGKTSLLGSLMLEIMPKFRTIVIEDSVTGDAKITVKENGKFKKTSIGEFIDKRIGKNGFIDVDGREKECNSDNVKIFSVNKKGKVVLSKPSKFIRHKINKNIYEIKTTSGKKIKVTEDHSLFTLDEKNILKAIKSKELKEGSFIAIPKKLPFDNSLQSINLLQDLEKFDKKIFILGKEIEKYIEENRKELFSLAYPLGYKKSTIQNWTIKKIIPVKIFNKIKNKINSENLLIKSEGASNKIPVKIILDETFLSFVGLWLADGCYDKNSVIVSVQEEENKEVVKKIAERFNSRIKIHSDKFSSMINSVLLKEVMKNVLELRGNSYTKKIPSWAYNLSDQQVGSLLKGFFSGDGCASDKEIVFSVCSKELIDDITILLLRYGIVLRTSHLIRPDKTINCRIGTTKMIKKFENDIGFLVASKQEKLRTLASRISTHDNCDVIPLSSEIKKELNEILGNKFNKHDYITRQNNIGREHLSKLLAAVPQGITKPIDSLKDIVNSDIFWDKVKSIKKVNEKGYVYDISVPGNENFICENILAHNTLELPVESLRKIGYDILSLKVRSALVKGTSEVEAAEGIRASLRLGDSALIIGEVRSEETKALYEAMRVGALANVVAGTIHGDSPYGVFDRVVNDLNVAPTSFKATDIIVMTNPIKTPDGLHSMKRVVSVTEVRKHWTKDPLLEKGFVDLIRYNVEKDELEPTPELINGDSEIIKNIAGNVSGWAGNWNAVYDNILLRGKIKQEIVSAADKLSKPELMEGPFNAIANGAFHRISEEVREKTGLPNSEEVFPMFKEWLYKEADKT
ncbi:MAG: Flp pilus assembly complex ATPase component TadA [Nanoarchaeota archaeon]|nr:Flp pilus assembly complex ATPase component TadA [Nanoarchaeota archaeon]MBU1103363.1 Flp pilus assembly complex ATPase component TadA [Nanoarchaeota archaeon]